MSALEDAARRYAHAVVVHAEASGRFGAAMELLMEREAAEHDLLVAAGETCPYCDGGDCPGPIFDTGARIVDTRPL